MVTIRLAGQKLSEAVDYGPKEVEERFGIKVGQCVYYKALGGDTSDNIPGVRGRGEKSAVSLLQEYGTLDRVSDTLDTVATRYRNKLETARDIAQLSRELATIVRDVPIEFDLDACRRDEGYDREQGAALFRELEFRSLLDRLPGGAGRGWFFPLPSRPAPGEGGGC